MGGVLCGPTSDKLVIVQCHMVLAPIHGVMSLRVIMFFFQIDVNANTKNPIVNLHIRTAEADTKKNTKNQPPLTHQMQSGTRAPFASSNLNFLCLSSLVLNSYYMEVPLTFDSP